MDTPEQNKTIHIIGITVEGRRGRFIGEYDDATFYALPFIRRFGCLPSGLFAWHLNEGENIENSERVRAIAMLPVAYIGERRADAERVLEQYEREAESLAA